MSAPGRAPLIQLHTDGFLSSLPGSRPELRRLRGFRPARPRETDSPAPSFGDRRPPDDGTDPAVALAYLLLKHARADDFFERLARWTEFLRRFDVSAALLDRVEAAPLADLDRWFDRALDAGTLDDVFGEG